jgi:predicted branched-subunit amino acid permease
MLGKRYLFGLILPPFLGWSLGTLLGAALGNVLPELLTNALGIALYAMFIAIVIPEGRENRKTALCILISAALAILFFYTPVLKDIPAGFTVIIIAVAVSAAFAVLCPIEEVTEDAKA